MALTTNVVAPGTALSYDRATDAVLDKLRQGFWKVVDFFKPDRSVTEAGDGQYKLTRRGEAGHVKLNLIGGEAVPQEARRHPAAGQVIRPEVAPPPPPPKPARQPGQTEVGAAMTELRAARDKLDSAQQALARATIKTVSLPFTQSHAEREAEASATFGRAQADAEAAILAHIDAILSPPDGQLTPEKRAGLIEATQLLLEVRQPRAASALKALQETGGSDGEWTEAADRLRVRCAKTEASIASSPVEDFGKLLQALGASDKLSPAQAKQKLIERDGAASVAGVSDERALGLLREAGHDGKLSQDEAAERLGTKLDELVNGLAADIATLHARNLLKPEVFRALSEVEGVCRANSDPRERGALSRSGFDALASNAALLNAIARGNHDVIDFVMGGDPRHDALALELKQAAPWKNASPELIAARHQLSVAKRTLAAVWTEQTRGKHLLADIWKSLTGTHDRQPAINVGGSGQLRVDAQFLAAVRHAAQHNGASAPTFKGGANAGRQVNLLVANVVLLQRALDAQGHQHAAAAAEAAQAATARALSEYFRAENGATPRLREFVAARCQGTAQMAPMALANKLCGDPMLLDDLARVVKAFAEIRGSEGANPEPQDNAGVAAARAELQTLFGNPPPDRADLEAAVKLFDALTEHRAASEDVARERADRLLGLDDTDLREMGFSSEEIIDLTRDANAQFGTQMKDVLRQGLDNAEQIGKVTAAINTGVRRLFDKGMAQGAMNDAAAQFPEARARVFVETVERATVPTTARTEPGQQGVMEATRAYGEAAKTSIAAWSTQHAAGSMDQKKLMDAMRKASDQFGVAHIEIHNEMLKLTGVDKGEKEARDGLAAHASEHPTQTTDASDKTVRANAARIVETLEILDHLDAMTEESNRLRGSVEQYDQQIAGARRNGTSHVVTAAERKARKELATQQASVRALESRALRLIDKLHSMNANTMGSVGVFAGNAPRLNLPDPASAFWLADTHTALTRYVERAKHVQTIESAPGKRKLSMDLVTTQTRLLDAAVAARHAIMEPSGSAAALTHAIRATIVRQALRSPEGIAAFEPMAHRAAIETELAAMGIDAQLYRPEVTRALLHNLSAEVVAEWQSEAERHYGNEPFQEREQPGLLQRAGEVLDRFVRDEHVASWATQRVLLDSVASMRIGDSLFIAQGEAFNLDTLRVPLEASGTLKARVAMQAGDRKAVEVRRTGEGYEVCLKAGSQGNGGLSFYADAAKLVEGEANLGVGGSNMAGAVLVFKTAEEANRLLETMFQRRVLTPNDWAHAEQAELLESASITGNVGLRARLGPDHAFGGDKWLNPTETGKIDGAGVGAVAGARASVAYAGEKAWTTRTSSTGTVKERETTHQLSMRADIGEWIAIPMVQDVAVDKAIARFKPWDKVNDIMANSPFDIGKQPSARMMNQIGDYMVDPFSASLSEDPALGYAGQLNLVAITESSSIAYDRDGRIAEGGASITRRMPLGKSTVRPADIAHVSLDRNKKAADDRLKQCIDQLRQSVNGIAALDQLFAAAKEGDSLSATWTLSSEAREIADTAAAEAARLRREAAQLDHSKRPEDAARASQFRIQAQVRQKMAAGILENPESYEPDTIELTASSSAGRNLTLLGTAWITWSRQAQGNTSRSVLTLALPGGKTWMKGAQP